MTESEIIAAIRRGIRQIRPESVIDTLISSTIVRGVKLLGGQIREADPSFFHKRVSATSYTNVFPFPTGAITIEKVWDLAGTAGTVTNASNATPIVITVADHGLSDGVIVIVHDVGGNDAANGTFQITYIDENSYSLNGSVGDGDYTSGGKAFQVPNNPAEISLISLSGSTGSQSKAWYPSGRNIVVDDLNFTNDIMVDHLYRPSLIADIPEDYHEGLVAFGVIQLMEFPDGPDPDRTRMVNMAMDTWKIIMTKIATEFRQSSEPSYIRDVWGDD